MRKYTFEAYTSNKFPDGIPEYSRRLYPHAHSNGVVWVCIGCGEQHAWLDKTFAESAIIAHLENCDRYYSQFLKPEKISAVSAELKKLARVHADYEKYVNKNDAIAKVIYDLLWAIDDLERKD